MASKLVSIIMPSLNQAGYISFAIESVLKQDYQNIELIVADGGSNDGTISILDALAARDSRIRWFSEIDNGVAEALNKSMSKVRGTVIGWLNSDDFYEDGAITRAITAFNKNPDWLLVYGNGQYVDKDGNFLRDYPSLAPLNGINKFSQGCFICQPTVFFKRSAFLMLGKFDQSLKTAFDFDYWLRAFRAFSDRIGFIEDIQAYSRLHDKCITLQQRRQIALEGMQLLAKYLGYAPKEWLLTYVLETLDKLRSKSDLPLLIADVIAFRRISDSMIDPKDLPLLDQELGIILGQINNTVAS